MDYSVYLSQMENQKSERIELDGPISTARHYIALRFWQTDKKNVSDLVWSLLYENFAWHGIFHNGNILVMLAPIFFCFIIDISTPSNTKMCNSRNNLFHDMLQLSIHCRSPFENQSARKRWFRQAWDVKWTEFAGQFWILETQLERHLLNGRWHSAGFFWMC